MTSNAGISARSSTAVTVTPLPISTRMARLTVKLPSGCADAGAAPAIARSATIMAAKSARAPRDTEARHAIGTDSRPARIIGRCGGGGGIRTHGDLAALRFSRPAHSTTLPPLRCLQSSKELAAD